VPLVVIFDGQRLLATDVTATFDNLAADGTAEPLTAVIVSADDTILAGAVRGPPHAYALRLPPSAFRAIHPIR
jgi:hypothetical protein